MAQANQIQVLVSQEQLKQIYQLVDEDISKVVYEKVQDANLKLKLAAADFLSVALDLVVQMQQAEAEMEANKKGLDYIQQQNFPLKETVYNTYFSKKKIKALGLEKGVFNKFLEASLLFNDRIIELITGNKLTTGIVVQGDDIHQAYLYSYSLEDLIGGDKGISVYADFTASKRGGKLNGRFRITASELNPEFLAELQNDPPPDPPTVDLVGLNIAYLDAVYDYEQNKRFVYFKRKENDKWQKMLIAGGLGDIAEAYASFFLLQPFRFPQGDRWPNLTDYFIGDAATKAGVAYVDNKSGLYATDIANQDFNYAIKALKASLPGYTQMLDLAQQIIGVDQKQPITVENIKANLEETEKNREQNLKEGYRNVLVEVASNAVIKFALPDRSNILS